MLICCPRRAVGCVAVADSRCSAAGISASSSCVQRRAVDTDERCRTARESVSGLRTFGRRAVSGGASAGHIPGPELLTYRNRRSGVMVFCLQRRARRAAGSGSRSAMSGRSVSSLGALNGMAVSVDASVGHIPELFTFGSYVRSEINIC